MILVPMARVPVSALIRLARIDTPTPKSVAAKMKRSLR
jgi:hypothetical protein